MKIKVKKIKNADLKNYSTIKIGGKADIYFPCNFMELKYLTQYFNKKNINYLILGNGSNILFTDNFKGKIISMKNFCNIFIENDKIICESGVGLFQLCSFCANHQFGGLEFLYGIPGSVGGAVVMNAGAYGGEICEHIEKILVFKDGEIYEKTNLTYSYRKGPLEGEILLEVVFALNKAKNDEILAKQMQILNLRKAAQPFAALSLGSVFKRSGDIIPAKLIDEWQLKGIKVGGAQVSRKHAGFIVNNGGATAKDVLSLIEIIENIAENYGYKFEREIKIV